MQNHPLLLKCCDQMVDNILEEWDNKIKYKTDHQSKIGTDAVFEIIGPVAFSNVLYGNSKI